MSGFRASVLVLPALVALPAPAAAADICAALNRIVASSREAPPFASIQHALANGEAVIPRFGAEHCQVVPAVRIDCVYHGMSVDLFDDWPDLRNCLGAGAIVEHESEQRPLVWSRAYVGSGLRFEYGVACGGCAGPAVSRFSVTFAGRRRPEE